MLVEFSVKNWECFEDKVTLSCLATRERRHDNKIYRNKNRGLRLLKRIVLFGGRGSGKTSLFKSICFVLYLMDGPLDLGLLSRFYRDKDEITEFEYTFLPNDNDILYKLNFSLTKTSIVSESLKILNSNSADYLFYTREGDKVTLGNPLGYSVGDLISLNAAVEDLEKEQLFLSVCKKNGVLLLHAAYSWFANLHTGGPPPCLDDPQEDQFAFENGVFFVNDGKNSYSSYSDWQADKELEDAITIASFPNRSQVFIEAHAVDFMDKSRFRVDEMWVTARDNSKYVLDDMWGPNGCNPWDEDRSSCLYSLSEYKDASADKDLSKSYLDGRMPPP